MQASKRRRFHHSLFDTAVYLAVTLVAMAMIYPFLNVAAISLSSQAAFYRDPMMLWPKDINLDAYRYVLKQRLILSSYKNTVVVSFTGTALALFLVMTISYPLSKPYFRGRKLIMNLLIFAMMFNGGLIPNFYLIRSLGLLDKLWALILPGSLSTYYCILVINYIKSLPESLTEAATLDGAHDLQILLKVVLPLCAPIIATIALFSVVARWNAYFNAIVYIRTQSKWPLQLVLREIVNVANISVMEGSMDAYIPEQSIRYAVIMVSILPILCVYPFLQKYFVKGVILGAVKG